MKIFPFFQIYVDVQGHWGGRECSGKHGGPRKFLNKNINGYNLGVFGKRQHTPPPVRCLAAIGIAAVVFVSEGSSGRWWI